MLGYSLYIAAVLGIFRMMHSARSSRGSRAVSGVWSQLSAGPPNLSNPGADVHAHTSRSGKANTCGDPLPEFYLDSAGACAFSLKRIFTFCSSNYGFLDLQRRFRTTAQPCLTVEAQRQASAPVSTGHCVERRRAVSVGPVDRVSEATERS